MVINHARDVAYLFLIIFSSFGLQLVFPLLYRPIPRDGKRLDYFPIYDTYISQYNANTIK